jgi:acetyl-CoA C-acetyltransferase
MTAAKASSLGLRPLARIVSHATSGIDPKWVMMAPVVGARKAIERAGWTIDSIDLFEFNEAFAAQALAVTRELGVPEEKVNVNGGSVAIGHAIGASGARVLVTIMHELIRRNARRGLAALCLGGGNSVAMCIERED